MIRCWPLAARLIRPRRPTARTASGAFPWRSVCLPRPTSATHRFPFPARGRRAGRRDATDGPSPWYSNSAVRAGGSQRLHIAQAPATRPYGRVWKNRLRSTNTVRAWCSSEIRFVVALQRSPSGQAEACTTNLSAFVLGDLPSAVARRPHIPHSHQMESVEKEGIGGSALPLRGEFGRLWNGDGPYELTAKAAKGPGTACFLPAGRS